MDCHRHSEERIAPDAEHAQVLADREELHDAVRRAADEIGRKELLYLLGDIDRTTLSKRLDGLERRQPTAGMLLELAKRQTSGRLMSTFCRLTGRAPAKRLEDETAGERFERLVEAVKQRHGQAGEETLGLVLGRNRR